MWGLSPPGERICDLQGHQSHLPCGKKAVTWFSCFSITMLVKPASRPRGPQPSHSGNASLSLSWNLSTSLCYFYPLLARLAVRRLQHHSSRLVRPAPSGWHRLTLMGDKPRRERLTSYPADLVQGLPTDRRFKTVLQVQTSLHVVSGGLILLISVSSVTQLCPTLCNPMNLSTPGLPVHHQLPEFTQTHVHWVGDAMQPSHLLLSPFPPALNLYQHQGLFKWVSSSHQVAKVLEFQLQHQSFQWAPRTNL